MVFLLIFLLSFNIYALPTVIYDNGKTIDANQFYPFKKPSPSDISLQNINISKQNRFPIETKEMSVGKVNVKNIKYNIPKPICIIGYDDISKKWLIQNTKVLIEINALCFVVNIKNLKQLSELQGLAQGINMQAVIGSDFAKYLNIKHYPVLINNKQVQQ